MLVVSIGFTIRESRPARGAWIEIVQGIGQREAVGRRAPQGARGLKFGIGEQADEIIKVAPRKGRVD